MVALFLFAAIYIQTRPLFGSPIEIWKAAVWILLLNAGFDYFALLGTRVALKKMTQSKGLGVLLWLLFSIFITFIVAVNAGLNLGFMSAMFLAGTFLDPIGWVRTLVENFPVFLPALLPAMRFQIPAGIFFWSTFYTVIWVLLYASAEALLRSASWLESVKKFLNIEEKPGASVGFVMGGLAATVWWAACILSWALGR